MDWDETVNGPTKAGDYLRACCAVWCVRKSNSFNLKLTMGFYRGMNLIASPTALQRRLQCPSALGTIQKQHRKSVFSSYNIVDAIRRRVKAKSQPATTPVCTVIFSPRRKSPRHIIFIQPTSTRATERLYTSNFFSSCFFYLSLVSAVSFVPMKFAWSHG